MVELQRIVLWMNVVDALQWLAIGIIAVVLVWAARYRVVIRQATPPAIREAMPVAAVPPPAVAPPPPAAKPPADLVTLKFVSELGRPLGETQIDRRYRRPSMQWKALAHGRLMNFVAESHEGRTFIYRCVGYDRHVS